MQRDFDRWNIAKKNIDQQLHPLYYHEREIWWCALGVNIGHEQDGTGRRHDRPILVIRGFSPQLFFGVALTGRIRKGTYYYPLGRFKGHEASVILSQARIIDSKRLLGKIGMVDQETFDIVCRELKRVLFGSK